MIRMHQWALTQRVRWAPSCFLSHSLSVRLSVRRVLYCGQTVWARITKFGLWDDLDPKISLTGNDVTSNFRSAVVRHFVKKTTWSNNTGMAWRRVTKFCRNTPNTTCFRSLHRMTSSAFCCLCSNTKSISDTQVDISETIWDRTTKFGLKNDLNTLHLLTRNDFISYWQ